MARPGVKAKIDLAELEKLCMMQCTDEEIAAWFNVAVKTIERRRKVAKFRVVMERGKARGRVSVRRMQLKLLEEGNATMGVWLGKQILGQTDHYEVRGPGIEIVIPMQSTGPQKAVNEPRDVPGAIIDITPERRLLR